MKHISPEGQLLFDVQELLHCGTGDAVGVADATVVDVAVAVAVAVAVDVAVAVVVGVTAGVEVGQIHEGSSEQIELRHLRLSELGSGFVSRQESPSPHCIGVSFALHA